MNAQVSSSRAELDREIAKRESLTADRLAALRLLEQEWDKYREIMRTESAVYEESGRALGHNDYFVNRGMAARREVDSFVGHLAYELEELFDEVARGVRSESEAQVGRLREMRAAAPWD